MKLRSIWLNLALVCSIPAYASTVLVGFSPAGAGPSAESVVLAAIGGAKQSIRMAAYSFTSKPIAGALVAAHRKGVDVQVVLDRSQRKEIYTGATYLANEGIPVRINGQYAIMHNKFMVIDGISVETGSFNYTSAAAQKNAENVFYIEDAPEIAITYGKEWERLWAEAEAMVSGTGN